MSYLSVERDQWLTACYHWVVVLWFWYLIESSRDLSVLISVICYSDLTFFDDFWYKVNEIQENKVQMLLDKALVYLLPCLWLSSHLFTHLVSCSWMPFWLLCLPHCLMWSRFISFPLSLTSLESLHLAEPSLIFSVIIFPAVSGLLLFLYQSQHPQPVSTG